MATDILTNIAEQDVQLCPGSALADQIEASCERGLFVINNPCYERTTTGQGDDSRVRYVRKPCRGYDTTCPAHPQYTR